MIKPQNKSCSFFHQDHSPKSNQTFSETQHQMMDDLTMILDKLNKNDDK